jgi:O-antigen ligase
MGGLLLIALIIGGSSVRGMGTTVTVQLIALLVLPATFRWDQTSTYPLAARLLLFAAMVLVVAQLLPIGTLFGPIVGPAGVEMPSPLALTYDWARTAESLLFLLPPALLFSSLGRMDAGGFDRVLRYFYIGLLLNTALALIQFASRQDVMATLLPYPVAAGFFANQNHLASLFFVAIPLVIYQFVVIRRPLSSLLAVAVIVIACFAVRSVAGTFLSIGCALVSYALILRMPLVWRLLLIVLTLIGAVLLSLNVGNVLEIRPDDPLDRMAIWHNTVRAILAHLPLGTGFGTFDLVYPAFESAEDVRRSFANHAHNEYLELLLEGGVAAGLGLVAYLGLIAYAMLRFPRTELRVAAFCGLLFLLIHSFVDYPLRNISMILVFALLNGIILSSAVAPVRRTPEEARGRTISRSNVATAYQKVGIPAPIRGSRRR